MEQYDIFFVIANIIFYVVFFFSRVVLYRAIFYGSFIIDITLYGSSLAMGLGTLSLLLRSKIMHSHHETSKDIQNVISLSKKSSNKVRSCNISLADYISNRNEFGIQLGLSILILFSYLIMFGFPYLNYLTENTWTSRVFDILVAFLLFYDLTYYIFYFRKKKLVDNKYRFILLRSFNKKHVDDSVVLVTNLLTRFGMVVTLRENPHRERSIYMRSFNQKVIFRRAFIVHIINSSPLTWKKDVIKLLQFSDHAVFDLRCCASSNLEWELTKAIENLPIMKPTFRIPHYFKFII